MLAHRAASRVNRIQSRAPPNVAKYAPDSACSAAQLLASAVLANVRQG